MQVPCLGRGAAPGGRRRREDRWIGRHQRSFPSQCARLRPRTLVLRSSRSLFPAGEQKLW